MVFIQAANEVAQIRPENPFHWPFVRCDDVNLELTAPKRRGDFQPIKLAPMMTARFAAWAALMIAWQSFRERSVWTCGCSAPGIARRTGSAPVASNSRS